MALPDVYIFNPTCEMAVANDTISYTPPAKLRRFAIEAAVLPAYFATAHDLVLCPELPAKWFLNNLETAGFVLPVFKKETAMENNDFIKSKKKRLLPWGWSPAMHHKLRELKDSCSDMFKNSQVFQWTEKHRLLYERKTALAVLKTIKQKTEDNVYISEDDQPIIAQNSHQIFSLLEKNQKIVVKSPISSSGRGLIFLSNTDISTYKVNWINGILKKFGYAMVEPFLDIKQNFAYQFEIDSNKIQYLGVSSFSTSKNGQYAGNDINCRFSDLTDSEENILLLKEQQTVQLIIDGLLENGFAKHYTGMLGVDAVLYRNKNNELKIHPCLEINLRYNMGLLSLAIEKKIHKQAKGKMMSSYFGNNDFHTFCIKNKQKYPLQLCNGKIISGFLPLIPYSKTNQYGIWIKIF